MRLDPRALAGATVVVMALSYVACFLFVAVAPGAAMALFGDVLHVDLGGLTPRVGIGSFVAGLLFWSGFTAIAAWLTAWIYNLSVRS